jgi:hypothetical protein
MHVALLGDSTFANAAYTEGGPDVVRHLERLLVPPERATLLAEDGALLGDVDAQLGRLRALLAGSGPPTHVALSIGGNDLLAAADVLRERVSSVAEALLALRRRAAGFGEAYRALLDDVLGLGLPAVICTVYGGAFPDPREAAAIETALRVFDHEILEAGLDRGLPVIDLRRVCSEAADYWNPIEPGERGGAKIAAAVLGALRAPRYDLAGPAVAVQGTGGLMGPVAHPRRRSPP